MIVAGDLNDEPQAATTQILLGPSGSEFGTAGYKREDQGDATRMRNLAPLMDEKQRLARVYRGRGELTDHLMDSRALTESVESVTTGGVDLSSITEYPGRRDNAEASDHRPVVATFAI